MELDKAFFLLVGCLSQTFDMVWRDGKTLFLVSFFKEVSAVMNKIVASIGLVLAVFAVALTGFTGVVLADGDDASLPGTPSVQLSDEDGLEPFDSGKIAGLIVAGVIDEEAFYKLHDQQGVSEEQLVAALKKVYIRPLSKLPHLCYSVVINKTADLCTKKYQNSRMYNSVAKPA